MTEETNLNNIFNSFGSDLEGYIKAEVKRQVDQAVNSMGVEESEEEEAAVASDDNVATSAPIDLSAELQELEDLVNNTRADVVDNQSDDLLLSLEGLGSVNTASETNTVPNGSSGMDYAMNLLNQYKNKTSN